MLPGAIMSVYPVTLEEMQTRPLWWWETGNGYYPFTNMGDLHNVPAVSDQKVPVGAIKVLTRTWDSPDKADLTEYTIVDRDVFLVSIHHYQGPAEELLTCGRSVGYNGVDGDSGDAYCYTEHAATNAVIHLKRYVESEIKLQQSHPAFVLGCFINDLAHPGYCITAQDLTPAYTMIGPDIYGLMVKMDSVHDGLAVMLPAGHNITAKLPNSVSIDFGADTVFTPGVLRLSYSSVRDYPGYTNLAGNLAFRLKTTATFDHARLTIPYSAEGLSSAQENGIKIYKVLADGKYIALGTTVDTISKTVQSSDMDSFGRIMVAAPRYVNPLTSESGAYAGSRPELQFTAEGVLVEQSVLNTGTPEGTTLLRSLPKNGLLVSNIYQLGPSALPSETPGTLKFHFDPTAPGADRITSLSVYRANSDGSGLYKLSGAMLDPVNHEIAVDVREPAGLYLLVGDVTPDTSDITPPAVVVSCGEPSYHKADILYVSTLTPIALSGTDSETVGRETSGLEGAYYQIDSSPLFEQSLRYTGPFTLDEGIRTLYYSGTDLAGNEASILSKTVYVDGTSPVVSLFTGDSLVEGAETVYITSSSAISLSAVDSKANPGASGLRDIFVLINTDPVSCSNPPSFSGPEGTCENPKYTKPFTLPYGNHVVYYTAVDNVGNKALTRSARITVQGADTTPPVTGLAIDGVFISSGPAGYVRVGSSLTFAASDPLNDGYSSGVALTDYAARRFLDPDWITIASGTYSGPILIDKEGYYTFNFHSLDKSGNGESPQARQFYVDGTAPVVEAYANGFVLSGGTTADITTLDTITLNAVDPVSNGLASGSGMTFYTLDVEFSTQAMTAYTNGFLLGAGTHSIYYMAVDNVGNPSPVKSAVLVVWPAKPAPGVGLKLAPPVLNLNSRGGTVNAELSVGGGGACFIGDSINISAVDGAGLVRPLYAAKPGGKDPGGYGVQCGSITVKFDREALASFLPENAAASVMVSGMLRGGVPFAASAPVRTIKNTWPGKAWGFGVQADSGQAFRLGAVYVFPDPVKSGKTPVFHIEAGTADSVNIRVYDAAGVLAHERTLTGLPQAIGSTYAYEYAWSGRIAGGVYYYVIEAVRAGEKLRARGEFSVIR